MRNINTPMAWKERLNEKINENIPIKLSIYRKLPVALIAVIALAVLFAGTALAYALTGGAFFSRLFEQKAETDPTAYSYIDVSQLPEIAGTTSGMVVDTNELRIDVIDVVSSGNDAMIALRVTAKQLDSVLRYTGWDEVPLNNYRFDSAVDLQFRDTKSCSYEYIYSDEDRTLVDNQFYLVLTITSLDGIKSSTYNINLGTFGYYDRLSSAGSGVGITAVYQGPWTIEFNLSGDTTHSRTVFLNQNVDIDNYKYNIKNVYLSPFSSTIVIAYDGEPDLSSQRFKAVMDAASDLALYLKNGTLLEQYDFSATTGGNDWPDSTYLITLNFAVPVDVENIGILHIFGNDYNISSEFFVTSEANSAEMTTTGLNAAQVPTSP
jgi:hypothetical protein